MGTASSKLVSKDAPETPTTRSPGSSMDGDPRVELDGLLRSTLNNKLQTEEALWRLKDCFQENLSFELNLQRVSAPLILLGGTGQNDTNEKIQPVSFSLKTGETGEIPRALSRWKRLALSNFNIPVNHGLYVYMNGIRPDEANLDATHSLYVDQWDFEIHITEEQRNTNTLKTVVRKIYKALLNSAEFIERTYAVSANLPEDVTFIHSSKLQQQFPHLSAEEREDEICKKHKAVFIIGIGSPLADGKPHGQRSTDLDDWSSQTPDGPGLNGDLIVWHSPLNCALELCSMSIRVNSEAMLRQIKSRNHEERLKLPFVQSVLSNQLPQTIGGGIGISRVCMFLLQKRHIAEVQSSVWPTDMINEMEKLGIQYL